MNKKLQQFARQEILKGLEQLEESNRTIFKKMYSHKDLEKPIEAVVADMEEDKLDWAMQQVERSLETRGQNENI